MAFLFEGKKTILQDNDVVILDRNGGRGGTVRVMRGENPILRDGAPQNSLGEYFIENIPPSWRVHEFFNFIADCTSLEATNIKDIGYASATFKKPKKRR